MSVIATEVLKPVRNYDWAVEHCRQFEGFEGVTKLTLQRAVSRGRLKCIRIGGACSHQVFFTERALEEWRRRQCS